MLRPLTLVLELALGAGWVQALQPKQAWVLELGQAQELG